MAKKKKKSRRPPSVDKTRATSPGQVAAAAPPKAPAKTPAKTSTKATTPSTRQGTRTEDKSQAAPRGTVRTKPIGRVRTFLGEVRVEMKKVTWPPRKELIKSTGVVIVAVAIAAVFIGAFDYLWNIIINAVGMGG